MKKAIATARAPQALGPYSQAVRAGNTLYLSGQLPLAPDTGAIPDGIEEQTRQAFANVREILRAAGGQLQDVVKVTVYLKDMGDFQRVNEVYAEMFEGIYPARSALAADLPKGASIELDVIAVLDEN